MRMRQLAPAFGWSWGPSSFLFLGIAALLQGLSVAWPGQGQPLWWLQLLSFWYLAHTLSHLLQAPQASYARKRAFMLGWGYASVAFLVSTGWTATAMHVYGGLPQALAWLLAALLCMALALYHGLACMAAVGLLHRHRSAHAQSRWPWVFAALWTLAEMARGRLFTGFSWGGGGYAHVEGPLHTLAPWIGVYGITAVAAWLVASSRSFRGILRSAFLVLLCTGVPLPTTSSTGIVQVALLQGNIAQSEKFNPSTGLEKSLAWYGQSLLQVRDHADLVVIPETALPLTLEQLPPGYWSGLQAHYAQGQSAALVGMVIQEARGYTNSVLALGPWRTADGHAWRYDKHHLVPFGEWIPPFSKPLIDAMQIPLADFTAGALKQPTLHIKGQRVDAHICYEDLFGEELAARFISPEEAPTLLVNLSNLAWFSTPDTAGVVIAQHLNIARMRAIELQRSIVRASNTGATAVINPQGVVTAMQPWHTQGILYAPAEGRSGVTPYARWVGLWGLWPLGLLLGLMVLLTAGIRRR